MRIYTRTGDDGTTGLTGGERVAKDAPRVEALGDVDELNAVLGVARALDSGGSLHAELATIQAKLLLVGSELAAGGADAPAPRERIGEDDVAALERWIDRLEAELSPPAGFVLPGGSAQGARLHVARTVCRRAERRVVTLRRTERVGPELARYLNRLGDLLFVMARWYDRRAENPAAPGPQPPR
jgi:cob(I)alamin adenosyltransferase